MGGYTDYKGSVKARQSTGNHQHHHWADQEGTDNEIIPRYQPENSGTGTGGYADEQRDHEDQWRPIYFLYIELGEGVILW